MQNKAKNENPKSSNFDDDKIDLVALVKLLLLDRKIIIKYCVSFTIFGLIIAITSPKEYSSTVVIKPMLSEVNSKIGGNLGGLGNRWD